MPSSQKPIKAKRKLTGKDLTDIVSLLDAVATDDPIAMIAAGQAIIERHPEIEEKLTCIEWWKG